MAVNTPKAAEPEISLLQRSVNILQALGDTEPANKLLQLCQSLHSPELNVVVFGEFNRGKSTLINALVGPVAGKPVLISKIRPTTGHITRVVYHSINQVQVRYVDGRMEQCGLDQLEALSTLDIDNKAREDIDLIEVKIDSPLLRTGLVLVDTPGLNDADAQTRRAKKAIRNADVVLIVLNAEQILTNKERVLAVDWMQRELGKPLIPVVNRMNLVEEESDRQEVRQLLDLWCRTYLHPELKQPWLEVNALGALRHALGRADAPNDDFPVLRRWLETCGGTKRKALQRRARRAQLLREVHRVRLENEEILSKLLHSAVGVEKKRKQQRATLDAIAQALERQQAAKREEILKRAALVLDAALDTLTETDFKGKTKSDLESNAAEWYEKRLSQAIALIETETNSAVQGYVPSRGEVVLSKPDPLTIAENMVLLTSLDVGTLTDRAGGSGYWTVGAGLGGFLGGPIGAVVGAGVGALIGWLVTKAQPPPDYPAAYSAKAKQKWAEHAASVQQMLQAQYDARIASLRRQIEEERQRAGARRTLRESEQEQRVQLDEVLTSVVHELQSPA